MQTPAARSEPMIPFGASWGLISSTPTLVSLADCPGGQAGGRAGLGRMRGVLLPREVYVLGLVAFCVAVGFGVLVPVLPVFARSFGVGNAEVGAVISAFALMRLISSPFCGWLIKILSERIIMATGIFIVAISSGLAGSLEQLPPTAGAARRRRNRLGDVHRLCLHLAAHLGGGRRYAVARPASSRPGS